ncbi:MAG: hypothetical protein KKC46_11960 [Proteobacteria bacterium]|nr:hypothetical protein [Pseudomonadota bacterium]
MIKQGFFIFWFLFAVITFAPLPGECEDWKEYFKDNNGTYYYDKDSIHYPIQKKSIFGLTLQNKEIVNVWTRTKEKATGVIGESYIERIYCLERESMSLSKNPYNLLEGFLEKQLPGVRVKLEPGSRGESLFKHVCP